MTKNVLITGANRGIGLSLCSAYRSLGYNVVGVCRKPSDELADVAHKVIDDIDITSSEDCARLSNKLTDTPVDVLVNNAGILSRQTLDNMDYDAMEHQFRVNAIGTLRVCEVLLDHLSAQGKIAIITSRMGSITDNSSGGSYGYRMSKAAVNAAGKSLSLDLAPRNIPVGLYHPGWVQTDMTGGSGDITPEASAGRLTRLIEKLDMSNTGSFWHSNGEILPW